eukprot:evm.model.scf_459.2 EVM.evm.TU.scf_459.2   scf_459:55742-60053(+)
MEVILEIVKVCVDLAIKIEESITTAEHNSEAKKTLAERTEVIKTVLGEIRKQHEKWQAAQTSVLSGEIQEQQATVPTEPQGDINEQQGATMACGLEQALKCVQGQLERAADMFEKMDNDGRLKKFWVAKGRCSELTDLDKSLHGAVGVLQMAHTALLGDTVNQTHQRVEDVATIMKELSLDQKNLSEEVRQVLRQAFAEKLVGSECSEDQEQPPNEATSTPSAKPLAPEECVRYNREMLQFLRQQMEAFTSIFSTQEFYAAAQAMPDGWANSMQNTYGALKLGWMLIDRHKKPFNLSTFYKNCEAQDAVNMICGTIKKFFDKWGFSSASIEETVPQDAAKADKEQLQAYLEYVLKDGSCSFDGLPESVKKEWEDAKVTTGLLLDMVKVPNTDEDIKEIRHIAGSVYEGRRTAVGELMKRKAAGHKPCAVNQNVQALSGLEEIMVRCTETDPGARYGSMEDVCNDLEAVISKAGWSG